MTDTLSGAPSDTEVAVIFWAPEPSLHPHDPSKARGQCLQQTCHHHLPGPTEPHTGRSTFLLSSGGAGGRVLLSGR